MPYPIRHPRSAGVGDIVSLAGQWAVTLLAGILAAVALVSLGSVALLVTVDLVRGWPW